MKFLTRQIEKRDWWDMTITAFISGALTTVGLAAGWPWWATGAVAVTVAMGFGMIFIYLRERKSKHETHRQS